MHSHDIRHISKGIPAICIGGCNAFRCHTREEYVEINSLYIGTRYLLDILSEYFEA